MALPKPPSLRCLRPFSTTLHVPKPATQSPAPGYTKGPPPYPYGPALHYKQSDSGLYGGAKIHFGNKVSDKNAVKTRRAWRPNMHNKRLWSDGLARFVQVKVQARVLRTIDKCGGLDEYLLGEKAGRIKELGVEGWRLRWLVMRTGKVRRRVKEQRAALGLVGRERVTALEGEGRRADTLEDEVERASGEVVGRIQGAKAGPSEAEEEEEEEDAGHVETSIDPPSPEPTALEDHINRTTEAIEAETVAEAAHPAQKTNPSLAADALPSQPDDDQQAGTLTEPPVRHYTKGEKRARRAEQAVKGLARDSDREAESSVMLAEVARIEEVVEAEIEEAGGGGSERLEVATERLRSAGEELERVKAGAGAAEEKEKEKEGGVLAKIKGLFGRR
ncbi:hypothetical protein HO173_003879 [Letharia columbiana]|uniref:Large ribosomal subunit protein bL28m n=1 Tax=Letharia columbiana TaxID=112416 RepID=A0A8H6FZI0_9LECA|nr:uncharacterized protein HO173_003879 [Letharia columbiana]KAF6237678.1 hypothetical protein HO173_003879 [Letharia columbiana]